MFIGTAEARILQISEARIDYQDEDGVEGSVDLNLSYQLLNERFKPEWKFVGFRNAARSSPFATFNDGVGEKVRFIFSSAEAIYAELLGPLRESGWKTMDMD